MAKRKDNKGRVLKEGEQQRPNGTYAFRWRDRRGHRHAVYAKTLAELREQETNVLRDTLDGIKPEYRKITINDLFEMWKRDKRGLKDNTFQNYCYMYNQFVSPDFGKTRVLDLKRSDVRAFYNLLTDERHLKTSTVDSIHTVLHQVLDFGVQDDYLRYNPSDNALKELKKAHNADGEKRKALTRGEQDLFEEFLSNSEEYRHWKPLFTVMMWTGLRVGELTGLRWEDINLDKGTITVDHTLVYYTRRSDGRSTSGFAINTPKTQAGKRIIPMVPKVREAFQEERNRQNSYDLHCTTSIDGFGDFVFINRFGGVQHQGTLNKALRRIIRDCNYAVMDKWEKNGGKGDVPLTLPRFSCHTLRHTFTTRMCEAGVNLKAIQDILGHADVKTTLDIYTDATDELKARAIEDLAAFFDPKS